MNSTRPELVDHDDGGLVLVGRLPTGEARLRLDYTVGQARGRILQAQHAPLARALGSRKGIVVDATAGLLRDALTAAALGLDVVAVERNKTVHTLAADALARARSDTRLQPIVDRVELRLGSAEDTLASWKGDLDIVLVDPMFGDREGQAAAKKAAPKKEMQLLAQLLDDEPRTSVEDLVERAFAAGAGRVVVKRGAREPVASDAAQIVEAKGYRFEAFVRR